MRVPPLRSLLPGVVAIILGVAPLSAQGQPPASTEPVTVKTFMLQRLTQREAADLVGPYVSGAREGVFTAGSGVQGVTVRGTRQTLATVDSILRVNDRPAGSLRLRFRLIVAVDSARPVDPAIADLDAALRGLFSYRGYRFLGEGVVVAKEGYEGFNLTISGEGQERYIVGGSIRQLDLDGPTPTAQIRVSIQRPRTDDAPAPYLLLTEVPATLGKTVVVGSSARSLMSGTMILALRPERP